MLDEDLLANALLTLKHTQVNKEDLSANTPFKKSNSSTKTKTSSPQLKTVSENIHASGSQEEDTSDSRHLNSGGVKRKKDATGAPGCNCRKSRCLKLYCQCFSSQVVCTPSCNCVTCANTRDNEQMIRGAIHSILERNPNAFQSKFKAGQDRQGNMVCVHKLGCRCRKSMCLKKYCECYHRGVFCTSSCSCSQCRNTPNAPPFQELDGAESSSHSNSPMSERVQANIDANTPIQAPPHSSVASAVLSRLTQVAAEQHTKRVRVDDPHSDLAFTLPVVKTESVAMPPAVYSSQAQALNMTEQRRTNLFLPEQAYTLAYPGVFGQMASNQAANNDDTAMKGVTSSISVLSPADLLLPTEESISLHTHTNGEASHPVS